MNCCRAVAVSVFLASLAASAGSPITQLWKAIGFRPTFARHRSAGVGAYSPDGSLYALGAGDAVVLDAASGEIRTVLTPAGNYATAMAFSGDAALLAVEYASFAPPAEKKRIAHQIVVYQMPSGTELARFPGVESHYNTRRRLSFSPDSTRIATANAAELVVLDRNTGKRVWQWQWQTVDADNPTYSYAAFDCTPDWKYFLFNLVRISYPDGERAGTTRWNPEDKEDRFFWGNQISADGRLAVAYGGANGSEQKLFELETGALLKHVKGFSTEAMAVDRDFNRFFTARGTWTREGDEKVSYPALRSEKHLSLKPDGSELSARNNRHAVKNLLAGKRSWPAKQWLPSAVQGCWFEESGHIRLNNRFLYDPLQKKWVPARAVHRRRGINEPKGFEHHVQSFSPSGTMGVTRDGTIVFPTAVGKEPFSIFAGQTEGKRQSGTPHFVDDNTVFFRSAGDYYLYRIDEKKLTKYADQRYSARARFISSPDGKILATLTGDWRTYDKREVVAYSMVSGEILLEILVGPSGCGVVFSPDGTAMAVYYGRTVDLYDTASWKKRVLTLQSGIAAGVSFSTDSAQLLVANRNGFHSLFTVADGKRAAHFFENSDSKPMRIAAEAE